MINCSISQSIQRFFRPFSPGQPGISFTDIFAEFFCSCLIVLGLFTRLACIPLIVAMSVALFNAHQGDAFGNGERAALYLSGYVCIVVCGPGKLSIDKLIGK
jgi:putative oxidoreductase